MTKHYAWTIVLWVIFTAIGEVLVFTDLYPTAGSSEADDFDEIFKILLVLGIPVFTFVVATVTYAMAGFRVKGVPREDGPAMHGRGMVPPIWLAITGSLALVVMIHPGLTGLAKLQSDKTGYGWGETEAELEIDVTAFRWAWTFEYAQAGVTVAGANKELVLPVDSTIKFSVNATDVLHSFWVPAFRLKIDAIPGRTTFITVKTTELGEFSNDAAFRVQCAELCGMDHGLMRFPIKVVSREDFNTWITSQKPQTAEGK